MSVESGVGEVNAIGPVVTPSVRSAETADQAGAHVNCPVGNVADAAHGWVYDRSLFATFNGGKRWQRVDLGNPVLALDSLGSQAYALVGSCAVGAGNCTAPMRLFEGTIATGRWRFVTLGFDLPPTEAGGTCVCVIDYGVEVWSMPEVWSPTAVALPSMLWSIDTS